MKIGTKSVLFGAHQFLIHPWFVALAWWKLYGFPLDPRLWVAFFVHDLGYIGKPNMDGPEGERHVELGASIIHWLFDKRYGKRCRRQSLHWHNFCLYHSRFYAKRDGAHHSRLCVADKFAIVLTPVWLYLPMVRATGEIYEYMKLSEARTAAGEPKYAAMKLATSGQAKWYADVQEYLRRWVEEHRDGRADTWTPASAERKAVSPHGVWQ